MINWTGTIASIIGSFLVAFHIFFAGYIFFLVGAACWLYIGFKNNDRALVVLNMVFVAANVIGLINSK